MKLFISVFCIAFSLGACTENTQYNEKKQSTLKESNLVTAPDFKAISDVKEKKKVFFEYFHQLSEIENTKVLADRDVLLKFTEDNQLTSRVSSLLNKYKLSEKEADLTLEIEKRVNTVPASLLMAQAANESAWGTSRFALQGNNYFGQWCFEAGCGLVPQKRSKGLKHEVAKFNSAQESVAAYINNINRNNAYKSLRDIRYTLNKDGKKVTGYQLASGLMKYSERGEEYVKEIRSMIKGNSLSSYD